MAPEAGGGEPGGGEPGGAEPRGAEPRGAEPGGAEPGFVLRWREHGGQKVTQAPQTGFGHKVMVTITEAAVHGRVQIEYGEAGLTWRLWAPMRGNVDPA